MTVQAHRAATRYEALDDAALVAHVRGGEIEAFAVLMQRCNQRLFRVARSVLGNDAEAEDALQEAWLRAYRKLALFRGDSSVATWLTSIVLNEARGRLRRRHVVASLDEVDLAAGDSVQVISFPSRYGSEDPVVNATRMQLRRLLEQAIDALPEAFRTVYVLREVEECTVEETAQALGIRPETVKTRLFRARRLLRSALHDSLAPAQGEAFAFMGERCARVSAAVMARLQSG